ncbi:MULTISPECIES: hypothetical protein [unclassified Rhodococcus (in: high G+C Gram-positive bacteria)]|uniref:hypothetical protein n=1 Tax=unclassified Rhodococcus (in: high G+C Gram-positive bacteria) TaxID=192944 RepID=UPI000B9A7998|nr:MULTISPECIES: hypothetical protein [unclassified Rhodococcus (in: high G+C Gram-positive bacteria)]OZE35589.1 hypothetical protein CH259_16300 [Rhodococcus sp. 05-2254-4]OZE48018.1 hypothetical protein CH261_08895 [Rhodococcus sp. 05-2254-3]OZE49229.1 hypothetical protein CH283_16680 [Rhodococcus sp. 05-2254-2]
MSLDVDPWGDHESYEQYPSDRYEQNLPTFYSSGEALDAYGNRGDIKSTQEAADLVFAAIFEGTAGSVSKPQGILDILGGGTMDGLTQFVEGVPIVGDFVEAITGVEDGDYTDLGSWVSLLFGRDASLASRVQAIENKLAAGSEYYDNFKRGDNDSVLGSPEPGTIPAWVQFGDGEALGIHDQAAQMTRSAFPDDGIRYARCPFLATSSDYTVGVVIHPKGTPTQPATSLYGRCNADMTEGVYVDFFGNRCRIGRFTRSGLSMTRTQWNINNSRSYSNSSTPKLRMVGTKYQVVIDDVVVLEHTDTSGYPIDMAHVTSGFSVQCWTAILAVPQWSGGLAAFAVSNANQSAIAQAVQTANGAATAAQEAQDAVVTVVEDATAAATVAATSAAEAAAAAIGAAQQQQVNAVQAAIVGVQKGLPVVPYHHCMTNHECTFHQISRDRDVTGLTGGVSSTSGSGWSTHDHVRGTTGSTTGDRTLDPHSHNDSFSVSRSDPTYLPPQNSIEAGFVRVQWTGGRGSVVYALGTIPSSSPNPIYILVGRMNPDDGAVLIEHVSPDQTAAISGPGEQIYNLPNELVFEANESVWLAIHQPGPTNSQRQLVGKINNASVPREGLLYPPQIASRIISSSVVAEQSTIAATSLTFTPASALLWIGIGQPTNLPLPEPVIYFEDFSSGAIPPTLSRQEGAAAVVVSGAIMLPGGLIDNGRRRYRVTAKMARDDHEVSGQIRTPTTRPAYLRVRSYVDAEVRSTGVTLAYRPWLGGGVLASQDFTVNSGDVFKLRAESNVFTVFKLTGTDTWTSVLTYPDTANAIPRGSAYRYTELGLSRADFGNSGGWEYILAQDLPDPE